MTGGQQDVLLQELQNKVESLLRERQKLQTANDRLRGLFGRLQVECRDYGALMPVAIIDKIIEECMNGSG